MMGRQTNESGHSVRSRSGLRPRPSTGTASSTRAAAAGVMVIASDEELIGRRVREHQLGLLFPPGDAAGLRRCLEEAAAMSGEELARWSRAAKKFSATCTRAAFRQALLRALGFAPPSNP